jgi:hypothetical protein
MNNVYFCHTLHNNMLPNNVMLYFPPNFLGKVYIDICNCAMARNLNDLKESHYIYKNEEAKSRIMQHRWWVVRELNYVLPPSKSTWEVDFKRRPKFTPKNKTIAVGKIAKVIYNGKLFLVYYSRYVKED